MARPIKNNADYFPHDADMRNDPKIKAIRRKFGIEGYGVYSMLLEFLTDSEFFEFKNDSISLELVAGDFDIDTDKLVSILQYCFQLDLFQLDAKTNIISCKSLDNRLEPLLSKRKRDRNEVIDSDNTQSRVKESKEEKKKINENIETISDFEKVFDEIWKEQILMMPVHKGKSIEESIQKAFLHLQAGGRLERGTVTEFKQCVQAFLNNEKNGKSKSKILHDLK